MNVTTYARIQDGLVAELVTTEEDLASLYTPDVAATFVVAPEGVTVYVGDAYADDFKPGEHHASVVRMEQARRINDVVWKWERHRQQLEIGVQPSLTGAQYTALLVYVQALRDAVTDGLRMDQVAWPQRPEGV